MDTKRTFIRSEPPNLVNVDNGKRENLGFSRKVTQPVELWLKGHGGRMDAKKSMKQMEAVYVETSNRIRQVKSWDCYLNKKPCSWSQLMLDNVVGDIDLDHSFKALEIIFNKYYEWSKKKIIYIEKIKRISNNSKRSEKISKFKNDLEDLKTLFLAQTEDVMNKSNRYLKKKGFCDILENLDEFIEILAPFERVTLDLLKDRNEIKDEEILKLIDIIVEIDEKINNVDFCPELLVLNSSQDMDEEKGKPLSSPKT